MRHDAIPNHVPIFSDSSRNSSEGQVTTDCAFRPRIGVISCGHWGSKHVRVLSCLPNADEVIVIDRDRCARENIAAAFPNVQTSADLETALPYIDSLIVATPPRTHAEVALKALRHSKHVLVEKPLTTSLTEARLLVEEASKARLILMVGHTFEFNPAVRELKQRVMAGELGSIHYIHSPWRNLGLYRSDVNVVWDLAPHDISIMNALIGSIPSAVTA
jgi:predicted dehydrogenase